MPTTASPLVSRDILFGNPDRTQARLSPDGRLLSWLAPLEGVLNVWVAPVDDLAAARPLTRDAGRGIHSHSWAWTGRHLLYVQDRDGDEDWHVYSVDLDTGAVLDLTPFEGVAAQLLAASHRHPGHVLVGVNARTRELHDVLRVDVATGAREVVYENEGFIGFVFDEDLELRLASAMTPDGGVDTLKRDGDGWAPFAHLGVADALTTSWIGFDASGTVLYALDSRDRDTAALVAIELATGERTVLAADEQADVDAVMRHPTDANIEAAMSTWARRRVQVIDERVAADLERLRLTADGELDVVSRTADDSVWIAAFTLDDGPVQYHLYDRASGTTRFLFSSKPALEGLRLAKMRPIAIPTRDRLELVGYLTLPPWEDRDGRPTHPLPTVLLVHGGPWARDTWGYDAEHQWLANRGYAVISVNFRGSTGFGKSFLNAGNLQWGARMHDDLLDAVAWAVKHGVADRERVGIMGGSYGGYATLVALAFTPQTFSCGVDIVGPSNLVTLLETIPPYWAPMLELFATRVGDHRSAEGRTFLLERSPLTKADRIARPLLIAQGANDPRVKQSESDQIVNAMKRRNIPVIYAVFPDEGHGFARPENQLAFTAVTEAFLARHLGGRREPINGACERSSIKLVEGRDQIKSLGE